MLRVFVSPLHLLLYHFGVINAIGILHKYYICFLFTLYYFSVIISIYQQRRKQNEKSNKKQLNEISRNEKEVH